MNALVRQLCAAVLDDPDAAYGIVDALRDAGDDFAADVAYLRFCDADTHMGGRGGVRGGVLGRSDRLVRRVRDWYFDVTHTSTVTVQVRSPNSRYIDISFNRYKACVLIEWYMSEPEEAAPEIPEDIMAAIRSLCAECVRRLMKHNPMLKCY